VYDAGTSAGADRVSRVEARTALRAEESGGVRGADEGEADQGVEAEGASIGAGVDREAVGVQWNGGGAGAGVREGQRGVRQVSRRGERMRTDENQDQRLHRGAEQPV